MKVIQIVTGSVLVLLGLISWLTPFLGGTAIIAIGLALLICASETAARAVMKGRSKVQALDKGMIWIEGYIPTKFADALRRTRPNSTGPNS